MPLLKIVFLKRKRYKWGRNESWSSKSLTGGGKTEEQPEDERCNPVKHLYQI